MRPGDLVALFSDGVPEAQTAAGDEFGEPRLAEVVLASAGDTASAVVGRVFAAVDEFAAGAPQYDDVTVLIIKRNEG
jgi:sigma-B regulation protein RsbU (phosphoserine phosphatase)